MLKYILTMLMYLHVYVNILQYLSNIFRPCNVKYSLKNMYTCSCILWWLFNTIKNNTSINRIMYLLNCNMHSPQCFRRPVRYFDAIHPHSLLQPFIDSWTKQIGAWFILIIAAVYCYSSECGPQTAGFKHFL